MNVSVLIPTYKRNNLLKWGLETLTRQKFNYNTEIIILDDLVIEDIKTKQLCIKYNTTYIHSGKTKNGKDIWRVPGYAINIGIKKCKGDVIILCCPEIYHVDNTINSLVEPFIKSKNLMSVPINAKDDKQNTFLSHIENNSFDQKIFNECSSLAKMYPFIMGISKDQLLSIGGYDEDFTGFSYDDTDLVSRLKKNGCQYVDVNCSAIHLWHPRGRSKGSNYREKHSYNKKIYNDKISIIKRNENREWGTL